MATRKAPKKVLIGYELGGHDNDSYMLGEETRPAATDAERQYFDWRFTKDGGQHPATCPQCGRKTDPDYIDPHFKLRRKRMDMSATYDDYVIVSERFRDFCIERAIAGIEFVALPSQPKHFRLVVRNVLEVDLEASVGVRQQCYCDRCGEYAGVFGTGGLRFKGVEGPIQGFFRTDLEFAQAHELGPVLIIDCELAAAMKAAKFRGLCLNKIEL